MADSLDVRLAQIALIAIAMTAKPDIDRLVDLRNMVEEAIDQLERQMENKDAREQE